MHCTRARRVNTTREAMRMPFPPSQFMLELGIVNTRTSAPPRSTESYLLFFSSDAKQNY